MGYRVGGPGNGTLHGPCGPQEAESAFETSYAATFSNAAARKTLTASISAGSLRGGPGSKPSCFQLAAARTIAPGFVPISSGRSTPAQLPRPASSAALLPSSATGSVCSDASVVLAPASSPVGALAGGAAHAARKIDPETRRRTLELLVDPDLEAIAKDIFDAHDQKHEGRLELVGLFEVLRTLSRELDLVTPDLQIAENLFKKFDVNGDKSLAFSEFIELFRTLLRRSAFDHSSVLRREFFINKIKESVWTVFEQKKVLGEGSFGKAYLAKRKDTGEERVIKAVAKSRTNLPLDDIEQEILIMRQVDHPHVLRLFQWYEDGRNIYLVLEALKGGTLKEVILSMEEKKQQLSEDWVRKVMHQCCGGMAYCHSLRLVHKDLKDENLMLLRKDPDFQEPFAVIIDLGVSEMFSVADPILRKIGGTPATMAPEVWKGSFGPKCDVWSMGVILFELLSGSYPFMSNTLNSATWRKLAKRGPQWAKAKASPEGIGMCKKMLTYEEAARPTMREVCVDPWFSVARSEMKTILPDQFKEFARCSQQENIKRSVLLEIASRLPMSRSTQIVQLFESLDVNMDGKLDLTELKAFFKQLGLDDSESLASRAFKALDADGDESLTFTEFAAGALLLFQDRLESELFNLFQRQDQSGRGKLDRSEARAFLQSAVGAMSLEGARGADLDEIVNRLLRVGGGDFVAFAEIKDFVLGSVQASPVASARSSVHSFRMSGSGSSPPSVRRGKVPDLTVYPMSSSRSSARSGR